MAPDEQRPVMVLYVSDGSPASDRARRSVAAALHRLGVDAGAWMVRNASTDELTDEERASAVITPMLIVGARHHVRLTHELDDVEALEESLRAILERRRLI
jgi:hypothetical protein